MIKRTFILFILQHYLLFSALNPKKGVMKSYDPNQKLLQHKFYICSDFGVTKDIAASIDLVKISNQNSATV